MFGVPNMRDPADGEGWDMAEGFYSFSAQVISRGKGRSAVAAAAYRSGEELTCNREGVAYDYTRRSGIAATGIALPQGAPTWASDRQELWQHVEAVERYKNAQVAREFRIAFPIELNDEQRRAVLQTFIDEQFMARGYAADWAIHSPDRQGDCRNWHAHVMVPMRPFDGECFAHTKPQEWGQWNRRGERLSAWRSGWANNLNEAAARHDLRDSDGSRLAFDHRSFVSREIDQEPTQHLGPNATAMERRGVNTELGDLNREINARNAARKQFLIETAELPTEDEKEIEAPNRRQGGFVPSWLNGSSSRQRRHGRAR